MTWSTAPFDWEARQHSDVRRRTEEREEQLSRFAARARDSADRDHPEPPDPMRTNSPTPSRSIDSNGLCGSTWCSRYSPRNFPSASSRE